jgi:predicted transposase YdaD
MAEQALQILQAAKQKLDKAKEAVDQARDLKKLIDIFEVTVMMIPARGDQNEVQKMHDTEPHTPKEKKSDVIIRIDKQMEKAAKLTEKLNNSNISDAENSTASKSFNKASNVLSNVIEGTPLGIRTLSL